MTNMEMTKWERARRDNSKLLDIKYFTQCLGKIHIPWATSSCTKVRTSNSFLKKLDPSSAFIFIIKRHNDFCVHTIMLPLEVILKAMIIALSDKQTQTD